MNTNRNSQPNHRILVVDDNTSIHADFRKILLPENSRKKAVKEMSALLFGDAAPVSDEITFEVDSAFQGQEALELVKVSLAQNRPYAMAFVDVRMPPGWDGIETIARIWEVYPQLQVVVCTAYSDYGWKEMRAKVGQPDSLLVLKKPFDNIEVQQLAHALTKKWWLNHQTALQLADLERANKSLAMSEERFSKAFHESPVPSGILDLCNQRFVDVNARFAEITGCARTELIGKTPDELSLWEKPELARNWIDGLTHNQIVRDQEAKIQTRAGTLHEVLVSMSSISLEGRPHLLLLAQDVAERALLERQLRQAQKMEVIGQLAAGVAHDFNNILTVIQGHAGLLSKSFDGTDSQRSSLAQISKAAERAATLIRQLLMFSRKQMMQFRALDLNELIENATKMLERLVGEHVQIRFQTSPSLPPIYADASMIEQVAMNLAVNARDAMPNGGCVTIRTEVKKIHRAPTPIDPESRDGEFVCLSFTDTGTGMDTQILGRIFEPFFTTKPVGKGTGLGLSTVFGIVRQHHGWIEVQSQLNHGTIFQVYFPVTEQALEKKTSSPNAALPMGRETILVAEDEGALREMVVQVLRVQGYYVFEAASGVEAIEVWKRATRKIDLLLTDMVMPGGIMGRELAEKLTALDPKLKVIYTSGYSAGMAGRDTSIIESRSFLPKPYSINKLAQVIRDALDATQ